MSSIKPNATCTTNRCTSLFKDRQAVGCWTNGKDNHNYRCANCFAKGIDIYPNLTWVPFSAQTSAPEKHACNCSMQVVMLRGCLCGGV